MTTNLKSLFSQTSTTQTQISASKINEQETYKNYGARICGKVTAGKDCLAPYLQQIFNAERRKQAQDENLQQQKRCELQNQLNDLDGSIQSVKSEMTKIEADRSISETRIAELKDNLIIAKAKDGEVNKMAKTKMIIGLCIIGILTVYLFIFYSSTFYTAFLFQPTDESLDISLGTAMFNSRALSEAWTHGIGEFLFIVTAPVIFMGLGYALHFFMVQKSFTKWFKVLILFGVTFAFDCILAYKIGEMIHNISSWSSLSAPEPYSIKMAVSDINSWAVVFCGFIVYVIWGIVFDMIMTGYEDLRSNKHEIQSIQEQIANLHQNIADYNNKLSQQRASIVLFQTKRDNINNRLSSSVFINEHQLKTCLSDFFAGWIGLMPALGCSQSDQADAQHIYDTTISTLFDA